MDFATVGFDNSCTYGKPDAHIATAAIGRALDGRRAVPAMLGAD